MQNPKGENSKKVFLTPKMTGAGVRRTAEICRLRASLWLLIFNKVLQFCEQCVNMLRAVGVSAHGKIKQQRENVPPLLGGDPHSQGARKRKRL